MNDEPQEPQVLEQTQGPMESHRRAGDLWLGLGLTALLHLIQIPLVPITMFISLIFLGLSQLIYIIPAIIICRSKGRPGMVKGLIIGAAITFLLNAACTGFFFATFTLK
ncbi:MAG TPA: hypothetical protein VFD58_07425 [Blastocatellia bacterium]|nr:hypothetical protein [Blastocatellia bacterium]